MTDLSARVSELLAEGMDQAQAFRLAIDEFKKPTLTSKDTKVKMSRYRGGINNKLKEDYDDSDSEEG